MIDKDIVLDRLHSIKNNLDYLQNVKEFSREEFSSNPDIHYRFERALHLVLEAVIDISNHLIADRNLKSPNTNREIFEVLADNNLLKRDLAERLKDMAGLRNILVHDYLELDRKKEYDIIIESLADIKQFHQEILNQI